MDRTIPYGIGINSPIPLHSRNETNNIYKKKTVKQMETTAKIKEVKQVKPYNGAHGTTYYHDLVMDNGDKINIGKKKEQQPGYQLTYEIVGDKKEDGSYQQEFPKAKSVQAQTFTKANYSGSKGSQASFALAYAKDLAIAHIEKGQDFDSKKVLLVAEEFNNWLKSN